MQQHMHTNGSAKLATIATLVATTAIGCSYRTEDVAWSNDGIRLSGTLYLPKTDGPHAAIVFISGSGTTTRSQRMCREHATHFASRGTAVLMYDKRGCGESGGDWKTADLNDLARDLAGGLAMLRERSDIDDERLVLMGLSQGAWVALIAAEQSPGVAGIVMLSGPPMTPAEQNEYVVEARLRGRGHGDEAIAEALEIERVVANVYRTNDGWEAAQEKIDLVKSRPWFADAQLGLQPRDSWNWQWYRKLLDYDPIPALTSLPIPILSVYGETDMLVPADRSMKIIEALSADAAAPRVTALIAGARHDLRLKKGGAWQDVYWNVLDQWLARHGFTAAPSTASSAKDSAPRPMRVTAR